MSARSPATGSPPSQRVFERRETVLFRHCDPAGIVFYPRYFELLNDTVEALFSAWLDYPFAALHPHNAVPTADIKAQFHAPSRHGDVLDLRLAISAVGRRSAHTDFAINCAGERRMSAQSVLVHTDAALRASPWPAPVHAALARLCTGEPR